ncbi:GNAT family N-acetyltransferase [Persicobacter sp. CCB-QB2]|uniref:GNAT family N-acetyltransferase n=1 Tax=Persicobacter sp. CCB-QB2 TaxID=1561025 RepID=UPI0012F8A13E|nr:GNAT family N-acetyltransferase [Persicobacter sp. CCB-QB2]
MLEDFLYWAIFQPDPGNIIPRSIIHQPAVRQYIQDFGSRAHDDCLLAEFEQEIIGAVWVRVLKDGFGNVDDCSPEFAIAVKENFRRRGVGALLMRRMIFRLEEAGYSKCSLAVQKKNYAVKLYKKLGFQTVRETEQEFVMVLQLG